ncbi:cardiolipin synthase [Persicirhabdus sediminis]|uniref:Cardiolipin synthase n=1 Tax=Persicirhabdus sediminis TaxID=454144 RepID=A0A8J7SNH7_9BACT|nr:cardiolipin synthase [Persicirhabdus sediminis]MBK1792700.1 cardiolipin synthase [Persicirhabdus sediminis]
MKELTDWIDWKLLYLIGEWVIRVVMLLTVPRRRSPQAAMSWLLVIYLVPWLGLLLFLMIGSKKPRQWRMERHRRMLPYYKEMETWLASQDEVVLPEQDDRLADATAFVQRLGQLPALSGNKVDFYNSSDGFIDHLVEEIDRARDHVHLLFYIYAVDAVGTRVSEALIKAAERGVECRLIVDAAGSKQMLKREAGRLRDAGVQVVAAMPVGLRDRFSGRVDMRNHRKVVVIDSQVGFTGSQNITEPSYGRADLLWVDMMSRMQGPVVLELQAVFVTDWHEETGELLQGERYFRDPVPAGNGLVQIMPSAALYPNQNYHQLIITALYHARKRVVITTPYLIPDQSLLDAMSVAVQRGVEVMLIVPEEGDQILPQAAARSYYAEILESGVKIHLHGREQDGVRELLHTKSMSVDGYLGFFGSSNFDIRSFEINSEINVIFYAGDEVDRLIAQQNIYLGQARELYLAEWTQRHGLRRSLDSLARLFSPLL